MISTGIWTDVFVALRPRLHYQVHLSCYRPRVSVLIEDEQSAFRISPCQVAQQLVDGILQHLSAIPELALADENIIVVDSD